MIASVLKTQMEVAKKSSSQLGIAGALAGIHQFFTNGSGTRDTAFVISTVLRGATHERGTSRTEEL